MEIVVYGGLCPEGEERTWARRLLAAALKRELGLEEMPELACAPGGKPYFPARPGICFNLSHSHGGAVCALHDRPVGVDIEQLRPAPRLLAGEMGDEAFFRMWTEKEAAVKRQGKGLYALLGPIEAPPLLRRLDDFLPGYRIALCPSENAPVRLVRL